MKMVLEPKPFERIFPGRTKNKNSFVALVTAPTCYTTRVQVCYSIDGIQITFSKKNFAASSHAVQYLSYLKTRLWSSVIKLLISSTNLLPPAFWHVFIVKICTQCQSQTYWETQEYLQLKRSIFNPHWEKRFIIFTWIVHCRLYNFRMYKLPTYIVI